MPVTRAERAIVPRRPAQRAGQVTVRKRQENPLVSTLKKILHK